MATLQRAGIEAGIVETYRDLIEDPQLRHRRHFRLLPHAVIGEHPCEALGYRLSATPEEIERPGPLLGEHGEMVYREILGLTPGEIEHLTAEGVLQ